MREAIRTGSQGRSSSSRRLAEPFAMKFTIILHDCQPMLNKNDARRQTILAYHGRRPWGDAYRIRNSPSSSF